MYTHSASPSFDAKIAPPLQYFPLNVKLNNEGYEDLTAVIDRVSTQGLSHDAIELSDNEIGAIVLGVRN